MSARPRPALPLGQKDIEAAQRTLRLEAEAISALSAGLDDYFVEAVELVPVPGGWWSPVWARAVTSHARSRRPSLPPGAPAIYVHPGEASHGDLGC